jgi:anti-anti-sigma factor
MSTDGQEAGGTPWTIADAADLTMQGRREAGTLVVELAGRVDGTNALDFQDALEGALGEDVTALVLDLEGLSYISSAGLRVMLFASKTLLEKDGKFAACSLADSIAEVFKISGFDRIIPVFATRSEALTALSE